MFKSFFWTFFGVYKTAYIIIYLLYSLFRLYIPFKLEIKKYKLDIFIENSYRIFWFHGALVFTDHIYLLNFKWLPILWYFLYISMYQKNDIYGRKLNWVDSYLWLSQMAIPQHTELNEKVKSLALLGYQLDKQLGIPDAQ